MERDRCKVRGLSYTGVFENGISVTYGFATYFLKYFCVFCTGHCIAV